MVWDLRVHEKVRTTEVAAAHRSSPDCVAVIEHVIADPDAPDSDFAAKVPFGWVTIEQISGVVDVRVTGRVDEAETVKGLSTPTSRFAGVAKVITCGALAPGCGVVRPLTVALQFWVDANQ